MTIHQAFCICVGGCCQKTKLFAFYRLTELIAPVIREWEENETAKPNQEDDDDDNDGDDGSVVVIRPKERAYVLDSDKTKIFSE